MRRFLDLADFRVTKSSRCSNSRAAGDAPRTARAQWQDPGLVFLNPSLRTLASFQSGMARMGGSSFVITPALEPGKWKRATAS